LKFGFCLPHDGELSKPENLTELSRHAEKLGFDSLVEPSDHLIMPNKIRTTYPYSTSGEYTDTTDDLDQSTTLSFVAAKTEKIRLMTGIAVIPYRNPIAMANTFATIDYLSNGRLDVGAGVGWMKEEFGLLKVPYEERGAIMDENLRIFKVIWSKDKPSFSGKYFQFDDVHFSPKVVQKPHPPLWIGGESPPAIRRAATLGDGWVPIDCNPTFPLNSVPLFEKSIDKLKEEIKKAGRKIEEVKIGYIPQNFELNENTRNSGLLIGSAKKISSDISELEKIGVGFIAISFLRENLESTMNYTERFAREIIHTK
jgi:probable F420-dependent oxidoreductase